LARAQLAQVNSQLAVEEAQKKQEEADAARAAAQARADLLARAGKGEVTLSEMRQALIGKTRAQVSNLLGMPSETASNSWGYRQRMILNPLTNEKYGLMVYFTEGAVQSVDYNRNGGSQ
jgi:DNA-binding transcriptional regulator YdaS (Cro superfamily)